MYALCRRIEHVLPHLNDIEELRLHLPRLDSAVWEPLQEANLKSISLSCQICDTEIDHLLYWPQLENLHIAHLQLYEFVSSSLHPHFFAYIVQTLSACLRISLWSLSCLSAFLGMHAIPNAWGCDCTI